MEEGAQTYRGSLGGIVIIDLTDRGKVLADWDFVVVLCTAPESISGEIARLVVSSRLAACVNLSRVKSVFSWDGKACTEDEDLLIIKTAASRVEELTSMIKGVHSYQVPEIIVLPIVWGLPVYLDWIADSVRP